MRVARRGRGTPTVSDRLKDGILADNLAPFPTQHVEQHVAEEQPFEDQK